MNPEEKFTCTCCGTTSLWTELEYAGLQEDLDRDGWLEMRTCLAPAKTPDGICHASFTRNVTNEEAEKLRTEHADTIPAPRRSIW